MFYNSAPQWLEDWTGDRLAEVGYTFEVTLFIFAPLLEKLCFTGFDLKLEIIPKHQQQTTN